MDPSLDDSHIETSTGELGDTGHPVSRRSVLKLGLGALGALALVEAGTAGVLYLQAGVDGAQLGGLITAGLVDDFVPGSVTEFAASHFFLLRAPDGGFLALHNRCTHLGCTVNWVAADNEFICPCHAASFDAFGDFAGPPVPRPLDTFPVLFDEGHVRVDTALPHRRQAFEAGQLAYAPAPEIVSGTVARPADWATADDHAERSGQ
ncbi:MAG TPA: Rieske (2Fe-2S) protein [Anaerolineae bacterium]|nr:Rieske (2Fe-2S) protein [Anaerolineae bacterium]